jgi:hypothetical protein
LSDGKRIEILSTAPGLKLNEESSYQSLGVSIEPEVTIKRLPDEILNS